MTIAPTWSPEPDACDCHTHVFDARFPPATPSIYALPDATAAIHRETLEANGLTRAVLIQPAPYGQDPSAMLDALDGAQGRLRGVSTALPDVDDARLQRLNASGVRALRFVEVLTPAGARYAGSAPLAWLADLAPRIAPLGWHAELWSGLDDFLRHWPALERIGVPIVLDHMAGFDVSRGVHDAAFQRLTAMVRDGVVWTKLSLCRRAPFGSDFSELRPFHDALVAANPDRLLWGSDWPFVRMDEHAPTTRGLLNLFGDWVDDADIRRRILVSNPAARYDFA